MPLLHLLKQVEQQITDAPHEVAFVFDGAGKENKTAAFNLYNAGCERIIKRFELDNNPKKIISGAAKLARRLVTELSLDLKSERL